MAISRKVCEATIRSYMMSMLELVKLDYSDGMTKQAFKDSCDINKILKKAQKVGSIAHLLKYDEAVYGEFENYDLLEAFDKVNRAGVIFADLPSEVRSEFGGDALKFAKYASDPANVGRLAELIPAIAEPGRYFPNPVKRAGVPVVDPAVAEVPGQASVPESPVVEEPVGQGGVSAPVQNK